MVLEGKIRNFCDRQAIGVVGNNYRAARPVVTGDGDGDGQIIDKICSKCELSVRSGGQSQQHYHRQPRHGSC